MNEFPIANMIARSGWFARTILVLLAVESIIAWAAIVDRLICLSKAKRLSKRFRGRFEKAEALKDLEKLDDKSLASPLGQMALTGAAEFRRILADAQSHTGVQDWSFFLQNQFMMVGEKLESLITDASSRLERGTYLLAIVGSSAPFLGLLGTVWGIMDSFYEIGLQGNASLPVVAPGIAEALITTIFGLIVAIPASFFYNFALHRAHRLEDQMDEFKELVSSRVRREVLNLLFGDRGRKAV